VREILSIHVGQCGNQIADRYWRLLLREHGLTEAGTLKDGSPAAAANSNTSRVRFWWTLSPG
jgi:hypothetical protein